MHTFRPTSIATRFLAVVGALAVVFSGLVLYRSWSHSAVHTRELLDLQSELALEFNLAVREYVAESVRPFAERLAGPDEFVPEVMSTSFASRSVFEKVRRKFPDYVIKFSSDNPRNPVNLAGPEELEIIRYLNENPEVREWSGRIRMNGRDYQAQFHARRMESDCLPCHGDPADASPALVARYGDEAGFHRPTGQVVALDTIAIPVEKYLDAAAENTWKNSVVLILGLGVLLVSIYGAFHLLVTRRLAGISQHFKDALAGGDGSAIAPIEVRGSDEIDVLAGSFNALADKLRATHETLERRVAERTKELARTNKYLTTEIAERRKAEGAAEVASQAKTGFLANMSHEIRTPLTAILGYAELLEETGLTEQQQDCLRIVRRNGEHLLQLINDLLDLAKIESGKLSLEAVPAMSSRSSRTYAA